MCSRVICSGLFHSAETDNDAEDVSYWPKNSGPLCPPAYAEETQGRAQAAIWAVSSGTIWGALPESDLKV